MRLLYKYVPLQSLEHVERVLRILDGWIYFSSPLSFNDPFELSPVLQPPTREAVLKVVDGAGLNRVGLSRNEQKRLVENVISRIRVESPPVVSAEWTASIGVLCLTELPKNILMWGHYASGHTGACIGFDASYPPFSSSRQVVYRADRPTLPALEKDALPANAAEHVFLRKSPHWSYEQEWRCVKRPVRQDERDFYRAEIADGRMTADDVASLLASEGGPGNYEIEPQSIRRIVFGCKASKEHRDAIVKRLSALKHVAVLDAVLDRKYFAIDLQRADA